jgi:CRISPR-associated protein Csb2
VALHQVAQRMVSVGHSSSLVRARFCEALPPEPDRLWHPDSTGNVPLRVPHPERLERLEVWLQGGQRPGGGAVQRYRFPGVTEAQASRKSWFGGSDDWFVFEDNDGAFRPDILAFAHVAQRVRQALMELGPQPVPEMISGHASKGGPTTAPHLAIVPLQYVGLPYADGRLLGFAIVLPRGLAAEVRTEALRAIATFAHLDQDEPRSIVQLTTRDAWQVVRSASPARASLRPDRWCNTSFAWASAMPVLLDRFPAKDDPVEEATILAASCHNIGLPEPVEIEIHKHAAISGAETTYPARGHSARPDWNFPQGSKFARRVRRHVVLRFAERVTGPVILGAGRFSGFGLCLPVEHRGES